MSGCALVCSAGGIPFETSRRTHAVSQFDHLPGTCRMWRDKHDPSKTTPRRGAVAAFTCTAFVPLTLETPERATNPSGRRTSTARQHRCAASYRDEPGHDATQRTRQSTPRELSESGFGLFGERKCCDRRCDRRPLSPMMGSP
jgi:hypothetical protein